LRALLSGSPSWTRTSDILINSQTLYQLSYRGIRLDHRPIYLTSQAHPAVGPLLF
jgi:hypothetical protein